MKTPSWNDIEGNLKDGKPGSEPTDAGEFWSDFKAHASLVPQDQSVERRRSVVFRPVTLAAACAAVLLLMFGLNLMLPSSAEAVLNQINSIEVTASHSAVLIMNDEPTETTILWIADMDVNMQNEEQT